jgi:hypothetical protein
LRVAVVAVIAAVGVHPGNIGRASRRVERRLWPRPDAAGSPIKACRYADMVALFQG